VDRLNGRLGPNLNGRAYTIDADLNISSQGATGVIFSRGGRYGGSTLFVKNGQIIYEINANGVTSGKIVGTESLPTGQVHLRVEIIPEADAQSTSSANVGVRKALPGTGKLFVNDKQVGVASFLNLNGTGTGVDIGSNLGSSVSSEYKTPNYFTGGIEQVTIQLK
jgi:arylsulfatase